MRPHHAERDGYVEELPCRGNIAVPDRAPDAAWVVSGSARRGKGSATSEKDEIFPVFFLTTALAGEKTGTVDSLKDRTSLIAANRRGARIATGRQHMAKLRPRVRQTGFTLVEL